MEARIEEPQAEPITESTRFFSVERPYILSLSDVEQIRKAIQAPSQRDRVKAWLEFSSGFFGLGVHPQVQGHLGWLKDA